MILNKQRQKGFTIIELLAVVLVIGILLALVFSTYAGIQRNQRNQKRERDIQDMYQQLEAYYVENSKYPTLGDMNSMSWINTNMKTLNHDSLRDPSSPVYTLVGNPQSRAYAYTVTSGSGSTCDNIKVTCAHYTLTATLENSAQKTFVKSSLN